MATRTWNSSSSTDANNGNNYSPTGALTSGDDIVLNATSVIDWNTTADLNVRSVTINNTYTGSHTLGHQWTLNAGGWIDNGALATGKVRNYNGDLLITGATGTFTYNCTGGTVQSDSMYVYFSGANTTWVQNANKKLGYVKISSGTCTASGTATYLWIEGTGEVSVGDGRLFELGTNAILSTTKPVQLAPTANTNSPYVLGSGYQITGASNVYFYIFAGADNLTIGLPAIFVRNALGFYAYANSKTGITFNQLGGITTGWKFKINSNHTTGSFTYDHNSNSVFTGNNYEMTLSATVGTTTTIYARNSLYSIQGNFYSTQAGGTHDYNFGSSQWIIEGSLDIDANFVPSFTIPRWGAGFPFMRFVAGGTLDAKGSNQILPNVRVEGAFAYQLLNNLHCDLFTIKGGATLDYNGKRIISNNDKITSFGSLLFGG